MFPIKQQAIRVEGFPTEMQSAIKMVTKQLYIFKTLDQVRKSHIFYRRHVAIAMIKSFTQQRC